MTGRVKEMHDQAQVAWQAGQHLRAATLFERAHQAAEAEGQREAALHNRASCAYNLYAAERYSAALAVLTPIIRGDAGRTEHGDYFPETSNAINVYARVAIALPAKLADINEAIELYRNSEGSSQRVTLVLRESLCRTRRMTAEAVQLIREIMAIEVQPSDHLGLARGLLNQRDLAGAAASLERWEQFSAWETEGDREWEYEIRSRMALMSGDTEAALHWAREAAQAVSPGESTVTADTTLAEVLLALGDVERARGPISRALARRHDDSAFSKYYAHCLRGDFWLASARKAAGMPPVDDADGEVFPVPDRLPDSSQLRRSLSSAKKSFARAKKIATRIDTLLECTVWVPRVDRRIGRIEAIEQAVCSGVHPT